ncbi:hypothetical protein [Streptomyces sp. NPDC047985]
MGRSSDGSGKARVRRVYDRPEDGDGTRVLVDHLEHELRHH